MPSPKFVIHDDARRRRYLGPRRAGMIASRTVPMARRRYPSPSIDPG
jgi:hypothetical protein